MNFDSDSNSDNDDSGDDSSNQNSSIQNNHNSSHNSGNILTNYYGSNRDTHGHYQPSVPSSSIPTLSQFQSNVYGYYNRANGVVPFDEVKGLPLTYFHSYSSPRYHELEHSNKILLPSTILTKISQFDNLIYPLIFQVDGTFDLLGVAEFSEEIDIAYIPNRIFQKILLNNGLEFIDHPISIGLKLHNQEIARGSSATLRAQDAKFIEINDHQTYLQLQLQQYYSILQEGQVLELPPPESLNYPDNTFLKVDVVTTKPEPTILITDTDLSIDFEEPTNYQEYLIKKEEERIQKEIEEKERIQNEFNQKSYERIRKYIPEYGPDFWDNREKESLEKTGMMPMPFIKLPSGGTIARLKFPRPSPKSSKTDTKTKTDQDEKESLTESTTSYQGEGHKLGKS